MGTTAEKFNYAFDTKDLLKTEINKINNVLDDNSTFRSYPQELFNGYLDILNNGTDNLWNNLEKVSQTGTEAVLEGVETAPMKMVLNGNTSQDTTSGKNLIKIVGLSSEEEKTKTVNDVTFTVNDDGTVKVEGTNSGSSRILQAVTYESAVTGEAGTYYYFANSPSQSKRLEMACFVDEKYEYPNSYGTTPWSKTATTNFTIRNIYFVINAGETVNNVYYVILTRNVDPQPYEPYTGGQPSPSPDYPQQVKVVKGENVVSVSGENQSDKTDYPLSLGDIELCKINTYKDFPFKAINGNEYYDSLTEEQKNALVYSKWYVHKEINKVVLDGSENWADRQQGSATYLYLKCTLQNGANGGISDKFKYNQSYNAPEEHILVDHYWKEASIVIRKDRLSTPNVANFKSWLSNNNVTLYYVLSVPTEEEITNTTLIEQLEAISKAKSVKDKTYITQTNDDLPFILDVEAIKEYEVN